jgi:DNA-directed RNA polymerase subunit RPC12/RpoP
VWLVPVGLALVGDMALYTCIQCKRLVTELVTIRPGNGQSRPPMKRCRECAEAYRKLMEARRNDVSRVNN